MIFILQESVMNGTVTMDIMTTGVKSKDFKGAIMKLKKCLNKFNATVLQVDKDNFVYKIENGGFPLIGRMENKSFKVI